MAPLIQLREITLTFGGTPLLQGVDLSVAAGERVCLVGRNGSGKSTLLKVAAGLIETDGGTRFVQPGTNVLYLPQEPDFSGHATVMSYVEAGLGEHGQHHRARYFVEELGLTGNENPELLSGGEARRAALARVLAPDPDVLLLDEPTNHLDLAVIEWMEAELAHTQAALVLISHDRRFLSNLSRATVWLDRGRARRVERGFSGFEAWRDEIYADEEREQHKLDRKIVAEEHWLRYGVTARRKRNVKRLGDLHALRDTRRNYRGAVGRTEMQAAAAESSSAQVIEAKNISKSYGDKPIVIDFSTRIQRGDRIGIVGPNGSGKTTLVSLLTGTLAPDTGVVRLGATLEMATLDQHRESLDPEATLLETLTGGHGDTVFVGGQPRHVMGYLKDFLFAPEQARSPLRVLSGGERGRLMLARALAKASNVLVLDEPTNDLDLETLDTLEDMLGEYKGTVLLISHDRDFLDRVVNAVIVPEGEGRWTEYAGGYTDMLRQRGADVSRHAVKDRDGSKAASIAAPASTLQAAKVSRKLTFKDKHALETLPTTMAALQKRIETLNGKLAESNLYARDRKAFDDSSAALTKAQSELATAEERWLHLEMLREEVEGADAVAGQN